MADKGAQRAMIVWGGWDGHEPQEVAEVYAEGLQAKGFAVDVFDSLNAYKDNDLAAYSVIIPIWTMGTITAEQLAPLLDAVKSGVGLSGCHGGMCDSFRSEAEYQFMTGGQWVSHPGNDGTEYTVRITDQDHYITRGSAREFNIVSEQYYLHVDPANKVLATTRMPVADGPHVPNGEFDMPVIWTKFYGKGRVSYNSLGHHADIAAQPEVLPLLIRAAVWAAHAEDAA